MTLAQAANTMPISNTNYVLYGAIIAAAVALIVAVFSNFWTNNREYDKWRREELIKQIFAVQDVLTEMKDSINNGSYKTNTARNSLYKLTDNTFRISVLVEDKFEGQYLTVVNSIIDLVQSGLHVGQDLRDKITIQQSILTQQAQKELKRKTPGPFKFLLGVLLLIIFFPLFVFALIVRWTHVVEYIKARPAMIKIRSDWQTYQEAKKQRKNEQTGMHP